MSALVGKLRHMAENKALSIGEAWNAIDEAADRIEELERERLCIGRGANYNTLRRLVRRLKADAHGDEAEALERVDVLMREYAFTRHPLTADAERFSADLRRLVSDWMCAANVSRQRAAKGKLTMSNDSAAAPLHGVVTLPSLAADIGRCNGHIYANGREVCPQREKCLRFLVPPVKDNPRQAWLFVAGSDQIGNCTEFWST